MRIIDRLEHVEWELGHGLMKDREGKTVAMPTNYREFWRFISFSIFATISVPVMPTDLAMSIRAFKDAPRSPVSS